MTSRKFHRREIIKNSLVLGAIAAIYPNISFRQKDKKLGIALVGLGNYSTRQLGPAIKQTEFCKLTAVVTGDPSKGRSWAREYNFSEKNVYGYKEFDSLQQNSEVDIVYIVLPNSMHAEYAIKAAQAGKHVIVEKPMAINTKEAKAIIDACDKAKVKLSVGYRLYFDPYHLEMMRLSKEKIYGTPKMIESSLGFSMADPKSWRLNKSLGGGGAIMDLGVYCIQGARRVISELPTSVTAQGFVLDKNIFKEIYEGITFQMKFPNGAISNSTTTYSSYVDRLHVTGGWQSYGLEPSYNASGALGKIYDGNSRVIRFETKQYQQIDQIDAFAKNILEKTSPLASGREGLIDMQIIEAVVNAADTGKEVKIQYN
jgi:predicted dehydrogenase